MHILITGASGFIGQELAVAFLLQSESTRLTLTDVVAPSLCATLKTHAARITSVQSDLTSPSAVAELLAQPFDACYFLHGIMSGGSEANLDLGLKVNVDSHRHCLDHLRQHHPGAKVIFPSSLAVYGPSSPGQVNSELTTPQPQSSYGTEKLIVECLVNDYSRRGLIDGRVVRLPTVLVRPGLPTAAASSFASGIVREPMKGEKTILPVAPSVEMWVASPKSVIQNLLLVKDIPKEKFGIWRTVNLPGTVATVQEVLDALKEVGGEEKLRLVEEKRDPAVEAIVTSWPARFDISRAKGLGMVDDIGILAEVRSFAESLQQS